MISNNVCYITALLDYTNYNIAVRINRYDSPSCKDKYSIICLINAISLKGAVMLDPIYYYMGPVDLNFCPNERKTLIWNNINLSYLK